MLREQGAIKKFKSGSVIFKEGEEGKEMYIIQSGRVEIFRMDRGKEVMLAKLRPGEIFGEMAFFGDHPRSASAQAVGETELLAVSREAFENSVREELVLKMLAKMSDRIRKVDDKLEKLIVQDEIRKEHLSSLVTQQRVFF